MQRPDDDLVGVDTAAQFLGCSSTKVYQLGFNRIIPSVGVNGRGRFTTAIFPAMIFCLSDGLYLPTQFRERHRDRQGVKSNMAVLNLIVVSIYILVFTDK